MIQLALYRSQTRFDVSQAFPVGQLVECHTELLIPAGEALDFVVAVVVFDGLPENVVGMKSINWEKMVRPEFMSHLLLQICRSMALSRIYFKSITTISPR